MVQISKKVLFLLLADQLSFAFFESLLLPQDLADTLSGQISSVLAMALFVVLIARMYFFNSIDCFVPSEWPDPWEQATEAYCYIEGAYAVPEENLNKTGPAAWEVKVPQTYYFWLPIILTVLAILLRFPDILWALYCQNTSGQPFQTLQAAAKLAKPMDCGDESKEEGSASSFEAESDSSDSESDEENETEELQKHLGAHLMSGGNSGAEAIPQANLSGSRLFFAYLMSKGIRLLITLGSLFFLQHSFGLSTPLFGIQGLTRKSDNTSGSVDTPGFPKVTFCDVALRQLGQWNVRTVQCVMPINLLTGKIALFLWFWLAACSLILICSTLLWMVRVGLRTRRRRYVKTFARVMLGYLESRRRRRFERLRLMRWRGPGARSLNGQAVSGDVEQWQRRQKENLLVKKLAATDRVFLLRLIQDRLGMAAAYAAMEAMTSHFERSVGAGGRHRQFSDPEVV